MQTFSITSNILRKPSWPIVNKELGLFCKWMAAVIWLCIDETVLFMRFRNLEEFHVCLFAHCQNCLHFWLSVWVQWWSLHLASGRLKWRRLVLVLTISWGLIFVLILLLLCLLSFNRVLAIFLVLEVELSLDRRRISRRVRDDEYLFRALAELVDLVFESEFLNGILDILDRNHAFIGQVEE